MDCQRDYERDWREQNKPRLAAVRAKRREKDREYRHRYIEKNWARYILGSGIKSRCLKKGIPFDLDQHEDDLNARLKVGVCELTGLPLRVGHGPRTWDSPSIDRIVPSLGYVHSNVRVVCVAANAALGDWGETVFRKIATAYLERNT